MKTKLQREMLGFSPWMGYGTILLIWSILIYDMIDMNYMMIYSVTAWVHILGSSWIGVKHCSSCSSESLWFPYNVHIQTFPDILRARHSRHTPPVNPRVWVVWSPAFTRSDRTNWIELDSFFGSASDKSMGSQPPSNPYLDMFYRSM